MMIDNIPCYGSIGMISKTLGKVAQDATFTMQVITPIRACLPVRQHVLFVRISSRTWFSVLVNIMGTAQGPTPRNVNALLIRKLFI